MNTTHTEGSQAVAGQVERPVGQQRVKYLLCPGDVQSKTDRQWHHVGAQALARLYGVRMDECEVRPVRAFARFGWRPTPGLVELHPRWDGDYRLPNQSIRQL